MWSGELEIGREAENETEGDVDLRVDGEEELADDGQAVVDGIDFCCAGDDERFAFAGGVGKFSATPSPMPSQHAIEIFAILNFAILGLSLLLQPLAWARLSSWLRREGERFFKCGDGFFAFPARAVNHADAVPN